MNLLDTDVLIDCLRGTIPAQQWLKQIATQSFAVPAVAAMELVMGCHDRADLQRIERFLAAFKVIWPEPSEFAAAYHLGTETGASAPWGFRPGSRCLQTHGQFQPFEVDAVGANLGKVVVRLLRQPAFRAAPENLGQPHRHFRRNPALPVHQF